MGYEVRTDQRRNTVIKEKTFVYNIALDPKLLSGLNPTTVI
jgi:hypothetical protein